MEPLIIWIAFGFVAILLLTLVGAMALRQRRSERLRQHFGQEYDFVLDRAGKRSAAERELQERKERTEGLDIHPLSASDRTRFRDDWKRIETRFVEMPTTAVVEADEMVEQVLRARGYPVGDFERHAADLSVRDRDLVDHYRKAHSTIEVHEHGSASTEDLRQAMLHYRELFNALVGEGDVERSVPLEREASRLQDGSRTDREIPPDERRIR
ncbi:MAG TPA: hypothetical protein VM534_01710 [Thermoanaerobaculia bacterium]|nr:hypothetical protein [Thermoanaerobaculia bacterium]